MDPALQRTYCRYCDPFSTVSEWATACLWEVNSTIIWRLTLGDVSVTECSSRCEIAQCMNKGFLSLEHMYRPSRTRCRPHPQGERTRSCLTEILGKIEYEPESMIDFEWAAWCANTNERWMSWGFLPRTEVLSFLAAMTDAPQSS